MWGAGMWLVMAVAELCRKPSLDSSSPHSKETANLDICVYHQIVYDIIESSVMMSLINTTHEWNHVALDQQHYCYGEVKRERGKSGLSC